LGHEGGSSGKYGCVVRFAAGLYLDDSILFPRKNGSALGAGVGIAEALMSAKTEKRKVEIKAMLFMVYRNSWGRHKPNLTKGGHRGGSQVNLYYVSKISSIAFVKGKRGTISIHGETICLR
jgi:hypothetical protein